MKRILQSLLILMTFMGVCASASAQSPSLAFQYDAAGNQIERKWVCINCQTFPAVMESKSNDQIAGFSEDTKNDLSARGFVAFPNPVTEILNVKWNSTEKAYVKTIEVFSVSGVRFFHKKYTTDITETTIPFLSLNPGLYVLRAEFSDGKTEILKVIKQ